MRPGAVGSDAGPISSTPILGRAHTQSRHRDGLPNHPYETTFPRRASLAATAGEVAQDDPLVGLAWPRAARSLSTGIPTFGAAGEPDHVPAAVREADLPLRKRGAHESPALVFTRGRPDQDGDPERGGVPEVRAALARYRHARAELEQAADAGIGVLRARRALVPEAWQPNRRLDPRMVAALFGTCPSKNTVTAGLQAYWCDFTCYWVTVATGSGDSYQGPGSGKWANARRRCASSSRPIGWRGWTDVDLIGINDPSGVTYSNYANFYCTPG